MSCKIIAARDWIVWFQHMFREANRVIDKLANHRVSLATGFHNFPEPPNEMSTVLLEDYIDVTFPRVVHT